MKLRIFGIMLMLLATFSCVKENEQEMQPVNPEDERFAEFDPVVRFGLDTYMGGADDNEPLTKTTYAGDDKTYIFDEAAGKKVRYERINWNVDPADTKNPQDVVRILSETDFTKKNKKEVDYKAIRIAGVTNVSDIKDDRADTEPVTAGEEFYWALDEEPRYFYGLYPLPDVMGSTLSFDYDTDLNKTKHEVTVSGNIPSVQPYLEKKVTDRVVEYLPNMANAYMYAAAKIPAADAGYVKVPLRFKPLFSAIKLIVSANTKDVDDSGVGAKKYRIKQVDLRTDLFYEDLNQGDPTRVNKPENGTALNGDFKATFTTAPSGDAKKPEYTGDFTAFDYPVPSTDADNIYKRLTIPIPEGERVWLSEADTVKFTFLALPIEQKVMTVVYTFEVNDGSGNLLLDEHNNPVEVTRYLALQNKTKATGEHNEFSGDEKSWFELERAHKLYVKSNVPEIQYFFDVVVQGNFPRTWKAGSTKPGPKTGESFDTKDFYEAKDFYSVISYRDSAGVLQPMRWKVTGYRENSPSGSFSPTPPSWLHLRGDGPWKKVVPFDVDDPKHPGHPHTGTSSDFDPWDAPQGKGTTTFDLSTAVTKNGIVIGYEKFVRPFYNYTYYDAGAPDNDLRRPGRGWVNHGSYIHSTPDGKFVHHENDGVAFPDSTAWTGQKSEGEAYAYDLSSHDIYGKLYDGLKNGDLGTTANCYVVSAPGWYRFPAVYGNAIKGGNKNEKAYKGLGTGDNGLMGWYKDHKAADIKKPWIPYPIKSVSVVWEDATSFVSERNDAGTRMDRRPFCETIDGNPYIYFYVDDIAQGNAVVAARDEDGLIVWSWHIWAVTNPKQYLDTITLQANKMTLNPFGVSPNLLPTNATVTSDMIKENDPKLNGVALGSYRDQRFWKTADLGQNGAETGVVDYRYCDVEFTQYFKGKEVKKVVRRFLQSGVEDASSDTPGYQWGRKDPMRPGLVNLVPTPPLGVENTHVTIREPETFYYSDNTVVPTGKRYDNLWNAGIEEKIENSYADGRDGGSKDREVVKTIYDPSPVGFVMPNMLAFSGLNPYGPISQVKFPRAQCGEIAKEPLATYPSRYVEFYTDYDKDKTYLRKTDDPDRTILFRLQGRINGTESATGGLHNENGAYYWTSEPALFGTGSLHGRSFTVDAASYYDTKNARYITNAWSVWPVAGVPEYNNQAKWQRTHGNRVRPMVEPPAP